MRFAMFHVPWHDMDRDRIGIGIGNANAICNVPLLDRTQDRIEKYFTQWFVAMVHDMI